MLWVLPLAMMTTAQAPAPPATPSVAVLRLKAGQGINEAAAELVTSTLVNEVRKTGRFSRVISSSEIESLMGFEQQKQLLNCDSGSCMAELAGSLGVDYVIGGTMGRLGDTWLLNLSLLDTHGKEPAQSMSAQMEGKNEGALLKLLERVPADLFGKLPGGSAPPVPAPAPVATTPEAAPSSSGGGMGGKVLKIAGGVLGGGGLLAALLGVVAGIAAAAAWSIVFFDPAITLDGPFATPLAAVYVGGLGVFGVGMVLGLVLLAAGVGSLAAGFVL